MSKLLSELAKGNWSGVTAYTVGDIQQITNLLTLHIGHF